MRKTQFVPGEYYHIYNRGVDKRSIFLDNYDFDRFLQSLDLFNTIKPIGSIFEHSFLVSKNKHGGPTTKLIDIVCFCLNRNHFHLVLRERTNGGISEFMKRIGGYTRYFNIKYKRSGSLFQGRFKAKHIDSNNYLLRVVAYVNLNNCVHRMRCAYRSSWNEYVGKNSKNNICQKNIILKQFDNIMDYKIFSEDALKDILRNKALVAELEA